MRIALPISLLVLLFSTSAAPDDGQDRAKDFYEKIKEGSKELEDTKERFEKAADRYREMLSADAGKRKDRYEDFEERTKKCEDERKKLVERQKKMDKEAKKFFDAWKKSTKKIEDGALRRRNEDRLHASRDQYDDVSKAYRVVVDHHEPLTGAMRDQIVYLSHELSDDSVASLREDAAALQAQVDAMFALIDEARSKSSTYMSSLR